MTNDENGKEEARREYFDGLDFGSDFGPQNRTFDRINLNNGDEIVVLTTIFPQIQGPFRNQRGTYSIRTAKHITRYFYCSALELWIKDLKAMRFMVENERSIFSNE